MFKIRRDPQSKISGHLPQRTALHLLMPYVLYRFTEEFSLLASLQENKMHFTGLKHYRLSQRAFKRKERPKSSFNKKQHLLIARDKLLCIQKGAGKYQG